MIEYKSLLKQELKSAKEKYAKFEKQLNSISKGNLVAKTIKGQIYYYSNSRVENKVVSEYLGKLTPSQIKKHDKDALERKKLKAVLKDIDKEIKFLEKTVGK